MASAEIVDQVVHRIIRAEARGPADLMECGRVGHDPVDQEDPRQGPAAVVQGQAVDDRVVRVSK